MGCTFSQPYGDAAKLFPALQVQKNRRSSNQAWSTKQYNENIETSLGTQTVHFPNAGFTIQYAYASQRGYYPNEQDKVNQDAFVVERKFGGEEEQMLIGVFDGHGENGHLCSRFVRDKISKNLQSDPHFMVSPTIAFHYAMLQTNRQLAESKVDHKISGTTAVAVLIRGQMLTIANVGDSRAVLAEKHGSVYVAQDLTSDQTPFRQDECERVKRYGARILTRNQLDGILDASPHHWMHNKIGTDDPPRVWAPNGQYPGTAFTRSIGDSVAEEFGVIAEPEVLSQRLSESSAFIIVASDGIFEFLSSQSVVDMVSKYDDALEACTAVIAEAYRLWLQNDTRTDDITMILMQINGFSENKGAAQNYNKTPKG